MANNIVSHSYALLCLNQLRCVFLLFCITCRARNGFAGCKNISENFLLISTSQTRLQLLHKKGWKSCQSGLFACSTFNENKGKPHHVQLCSTWRLIKKGLRTLFTCFSTICNTFLHYLCSRIARQLDKTIRTIHNWIAGHLSVAKHEVGIWKYGTINRMLDYDWHQFEIVNYFHAFRAIWDHE